MIAPAKKCLSLICAGGLWAACALAQSPVTLTIGSGADGQAIPDDFIGLSFGTRVLPPGKSGSHFFSPTNTALINIFQNLAIRHLRVGGTTVESPPETPIPNQTDIDNLFAFARAAGVKKIIYSLRLLQTDPARSYAATNAAIAKYIWTHYQPYLECFALGNEPDRKAIFSRDIAITNFTTYLARWDAMASAITNAVPGAKIGGPDADSGNIRWTTNFAESEKKTGLLSIATEHYYAGGAGKGLDPREGIETMLSPGWIKNYQKLYDKMAVPVLSSGVPFRFTEANDHYSGGGREASDTFAGALWALDFLHWWAAHDTRGVDFHNTQWVVNDVITHDAVGRLMINPKGCGLKTFDLGAHGNVTPVAISNSGGVNLTAYAVHNGDDFFVTVINKDHGPVARAADITIVSGGMKSAKAMFLTAPASDVTAKTGVTLGGAPISNDSPWRGQWTPLVSREAGRCAIKLPAASAVVVNISKK